MHDRAPGCPTAQNTEALPGQCPASSGHLLTRLVLPWAGLALATAGAVVPFVVDRLTDWLWVNREIHTALEITIALSALAIVVTMVGCRRGQLDGKTILASTALTAPFSAFVGSRR